MEKLTSPILESLLQAKKKLHEDLESVMQKIKGECERLAFEAYQIRPGSIVEHGGKTYMVSRIDVFYGGRPCAYGGLAKKDGTFQNRDFWLGRSWKVITP